MSKFRVGDKIKFKGCRVGGYYFNGHNKEPAMVGNTFIVSAVDNDKKLYSVEGAYVQQPNWGGVEDNFELVIRSFEF